MKEKFFKTPYSGPPPPYKVEEIDRNKIYNQYKKNVSHPHKPETKMEPERSAMETPKTNGRDNPAPDFSKRACLSEISSVI